MQQDRLLSALIGDIYDAALDPARWQNVLASVARFVGGASATLFPRREVARQDCSSTSTASNLHTGASVARIVVTLAPLTASFAHIERAAADCTPASPVNNTTVTCTGT